MRSVVCELRGAGPPCSPPRASMRACCASLRSRAPCCSRPAPAGRPPSRALACQAPAKNGLGPPSWGTEDPATPCCTFDACGKRTCGTDCDDTRWVFVRESRREGGPRALGASRPAPFPSVRIAHPAREQDLDQEALSRHPADGRVDDPDPWPTGLAGRHVPLRDEPRGHLGRGADEVQRARPDPPLSPRLRS